MNRSQDRSSWSGSCHLKHTPQKVKNRFEMPERKRTMEKDCVKDFYGPSLEGSHFTPLTFGCTWLQRAVGRTAHRYEWGSKNLWWRAICLCHNSNAMRVRNTPHSAFHTASQRLLTSGSCCYLAAVAVALSLVIIRPANAIMKSLHDLDIQKWKLSLNPIVSILEVEVT